MALVPLLSPALTRSSVVGCEINKYLSKSDLKNLKLSLRTEEAPKWVDNPTNCVHEDCFSEAIPYKLKNKTLLFIICFECKRTYRK